MIFIIAHHYVVNSAVLPVMQENPTDLSTMFLLLFGAWGKTGINCFVLITGYFMCKSSITVYKFMKLVVEILFYNVIVYAMFVASGFVDFSIKGFAGNFFLINNLNSDFTSGFIMFYLFIPFLTILVQNLTKRQHLSLALLCLLTFTLFGSMPAIIKIRVNYVVHFSILFILASYVRYYGFPLKVSHKGWGWLTLLSFILGASSILVLLGAYMKGFLGDRFTFVYFFVSDSNKVLAMTTAFCAFMWFKGLKIGYSPLINTLGAATFGVLLIHANSNAMRDWLWNHVVDTAGHFNDPYLFLYAPGCVLAIFMICAAIDTMRSRWLEEPMLKPFVNLAGKARGLVSTKI